MDTHPPMLNSANVNRNQRPHAESAFYDGQAGPFWERFDFDADTSSDLSEELYRDVECFSDEDLDQRTYSAAAYLRSISQSQNNRLSVPLSQPMTMSVTKSVAMRTREKLKEANKPALGIIYFIIYCFLKSLSYVTVTLLFEASCDLLAFQMLFIRSVFGIALMIIQLNVSIKKETYDSIQREQVGALIFKTFTGVTTNIINYSLTKFISGTIITVVANLAPIIVVVLAFFILKEVIRKFDVLMMLLTLVGIFVTIFTGEE